MFKQASDLYARCRRLPVFCRQPPPPRPVRPHCSIVVAVAVCRRAQSRTVNTVFRSTWKMENGIRTQLSTFFSECENRKKWIFILYFSCFSLNETKRNAGYRWSSSAESTRFRALGPRASAWFWLGDPLPPEAKFFVENLTTKWCILKYIWINTWSA